MEDDGSRNPEPDGLLRDVLADFVLLEWFRLEMG